MIALRMRSSDLHLRLGEAIDKARVAPVVVTKHERDHVVIMSAARYEELTRAARKAKRTGALTSRQRELAASAVVPSETEQQEYLAELAAAVGSDK